MVRFFDFLVAKMHAGIGHLKSRALYEQKRSDLRIDVICSIGHSYYCCHTVDDVVRRLSKVHGPFSGPAVIRTIRDLKRERFIVGPFGRLAHDAQLQLTPQGSLEHTGIHICKKLRASKEQVAA